VEVKIGVQHVAREITFETEASAQDVAKAVSQAIEKNGLLTLTDDKGRQIIVPGNVLGYVSLGESERRGVGFGAL
jgi:ABC-type Fe3+-hydroxamate transport system substrate-binding protein